MKIPFRTMAMALALLGLAAGCNDDEDAIVPVTFPADVSGTWDAVFVHANGTDQSTGTVTLAQVGSAVTVTMQFDTPALFGGWPGWGSTGTYNSSTGVLVATAGATDALTLGFTNAGSATGTFVSEAGATTFQVTLSAP